MPENVVVIVESPTKARTIRRFLPKNYHVEASVGHVRDLPQTAQDIPASVKKEEWARLGINVENDFAPLYITPKGKSKVIAELRKKVKAADEVLLATDEDREGESISWHLVEVLKPKAPVRRMVFHEITKTAIEHALAHSREIDMRLVKAQETRRILDRLYGYTLSPLIWKKIAYGLSAGRVQSPGLRLIVERERERIRFRKSVYWDIRAELRREIDAAEAAFEARLVSVDAKRVAAGKDFDPETGRLEKPDDFTVVTEEAARALVERIKAATWRVTSVTEKKTTSRPSPPFITSTLQQEGNRKLGLTARETMRIAQRLYEEGLITYMRTDSPTLSSEGTGGARGAVEALYGKEYLTEEPRQFSSRSKDAQEAHEAIRPAGAEFVHPDEAGLTGKERGLYELIWKRTLASQMADARKSSVSVRFDADGCEFVSSGVRILFPGFLRVYVEGKDDPDAALEDKEILLPELHENDTVVPESLEPTYHETKPPARYTEASLVQRLERAGIGRPSTYATIISTLFERDYIRKQGSALAPTFTGIAVVQLLENHFRYLIEYGFTSDMENALDEIAAGERNHLDYLRGFYLGENGLKTLVDEREGSIVAEKCRTIVLPQISDAFEVKVGRFGPYIIHRANGASGVAASGGEKANGTEEIRASIPEEIAPADLTPDDIEELIRIQRDGPKPIGVDPETNENIYCLVGRYGPYVQLGEQTEEGPKPRRASLPKEIKPRDVDLPTALKLLSLPRTLGTHPENGKEIVANVGRFGPFVVCDGDFRSLKKDDDVYTVTLDRALEILAEEKKARRGGSVLLKDLGTDPKTEKKIAVYEGKYGPYIKYGSKNVGLPDELKDEKKIEALTFDAAIEIVEKNGSRKKK